MNCRNCHSAINPNVSTINYFVCRGKIRLNCIGLNESEVKWTRTKSKALKVVCNFCNDNIGQYNDIKDQTQLITNLNQIKDDLQAHINNLKSMSSIKPVHDFQFEDVI